ncbi:hypothetical protein [Burkholderia gladioli]|uniref:hypothetical protein n=1 Tax=Burkholderia gladioli TaxID=28095 RepID=UPI001C27631F|nr:hypothetical protein [Burkholderia gladioli]MBU9380637.1 hypothetical protein [Burkholderia gladioli]
MKKILRVLFTCITAISSTAIARQDQVAFVFAQQGPDSGIIKKGDFLYVLALKEPCTLSIPNGKYMLAAKIFNNRAHPERPDIGCWALTTHPSKAEIVVVGPMGNVASGMSLTQFTKASLLPNGDAKVIGPAMTQQQFDENLRGYANSLR